MLRQPMGTRILSSILNALFWCVLLVVITGGFDWHGSIGERAVRLDATSPDLFALLFVILLVIWYRLGRSPREIEGVRIWERFYARLDNASAGRWLPVLGLMAAVLVALPLARHFTFQSGYDLALFAQAYWNTLQGDFLYSSLKGGMVLWGDHFNPIALAIVPFYRIWPAPETLLVIQSLALVASWIPGEIGDKPPYAKQIRFRTLGQIRKRCSGCDESRVEDICGVSGSFPVRLLRPIGDAPVCRRRGSHGGQDYGRDC